MSIDKRIAFGAAASWISRTVTIILGLGVMPVLFRHLSKEELGVWLLLGQSWAALGILDFGFGVTLTRRIALAKGKSGGDPNAALNEESRRNIADLLASGQRIYRVMAFGTFATAWLTGFWFLRNLTLYETSFATVWVAWTILCVSLAFNVWAAIWTCLLHGVGYVGTDSIISSLINAAIAITQIIAVLWSGGLVTLAGIAALGALSQRFLIRWLANRCVSKLLLVDGKWNRMLIRGAPGLALRAWLTSLGTILALNTDSFFIAGMRSTDNIPVYRAAYIILLNLNMLAVTLSSTSSVFITQLWQAGAFKEIHRVVTRNMRTGLTIMACGGGTVLALGPSLFDIWLGRGNFIGFPTLTLFFLILSLEAQSFILATSSRATEDEAFAEWALAGGILKIALSYGFAARLGLFGLALGTLVAQCCTIHWFTALRALRRLRIGFRAYISRILLPAGFACVGTFVAVRSIGHLTVGQTSHSVLSGVFTGIIMLVLALWILVFTAEERARLRRMFSLDRTT